MHSTDNCPVLMWWVTYNTIDEYQVGQEKKYCKITNSNNINLVTYANLLIRQLLLKLDEILLEYCTIIVFKKKKTFQRACSVLIAVTNLEEAVCSMLNREIEYKKCEPSYQTVP